MAAPSGMLLLQGGLELLCEIRAEVRVMLALARGGGRALPQAPMPAVSAAPAVSVADGASTAPAASAAPAASSAWAGAASAAPAAGAAPASASPAAGGSCTSSHGPHVGVAWFEERVWEPCKDGGSLPRCLYCNRLADSEHVLSPEHEEVFDRLNDARQEHGLPEVPYKPPTSLTGRPA